MKVVIQRVLEASVKINGVVKGEIGQGLTVFAGFTHDDTTEDLRIFDDENHVMNLSVRDINGGILLISQFTLHAMTKKGNRPSYVLAAKSEISKPLYEEFISLLESEADRKIQTGEFGADMKVSLINDGPVTIIIDSKNRI